MVQPLIKMNLSEIVLQHNMLILFLQLDFMYNPHIIYAITCNKYKKKKQPQQHGYVLSTRSY